MSIYSYVKIKNIPEVLLCQPDSYMEMKKASPNDLPPSGWLKNKKTAESSAVFVRSSYGNRTHDSAVRGQRLSLLTNEPYLPAELCVPKRLCFMSRASKILL